MGGICGIVNDNANENEVRIALNKMLLKLRHYDSYEDGIFTKEGVAVGVCDLPYTSPFPLPRVFRNENIVFLMKGEIFRSSHSKISTYNNYLKNQHLEKIDDGLHHLCQKYLKTKEHSVFFGLNGHYVVVIVDSQSKCLKIINDRHGFVPCYFYSNKDLFLFSSELKAIPACDQIPLHCDMDGLAQFFQIGHFVHETTLIDGVKCLPPGSCLIHKHGKQSINTYWEYVPKASRQKKKDKDYLAEIEYRFKQSVERRLTEGEEFGISLSGGIDSRVILSCIDAERYPIQSFTRGQHGCLELLVAEEVARTHGVSHTSHFFPEGYLQKYSVQMVSHNDCVAPIYDAHAIFPVSDFPSRELFIFNGFCGEVWRGFWKSAKLRRFARENPKAFPKLFYQKNYPLPDEQLQQLFLPDVWKYLKGICKDYFEKICADINRDFSPVKQLALLYLKQRARRYIIGGPLILSQKFGYRSVYTDIDLLDAVFMLPDNLMFGKKIPNYIIKNNSSHLLDIMYEKTQLPLSASSTSVYAYKLANRWKKYLHFPQKFPIRVTDYNSWICKENAFVRNVLQFEKLQSRKLYNLDFIKKVLHKHKEGNPIYSRLFYRLLTFEIWYQNNLESSVRLEDE
jgi:asparagine synthase (glutamine-hydrolysing)